MDINSFSPLMQWAFSHGYWIMFVVAVIEGPILGVVCGLFIRLGLFHFWPIFLILMAGDLVGDVLWYQVGRYGANPLIKKFGHFVNLHPENVATIERVFKKHHGKTLIISKMTAGFGFSLITLITAGSIRIPFKKYMAINIAGQFFWSGFVIAVGYFFGQFYETINKDFRIMSIVAFLAAVMVVLYGVKQYAKSVMLKQSQ